MLLSCHRSPWGRKLGKSWIARRAISKHKSNLTISKLKFASCVKNAGNCETTRNQTSGLLSKTNASGAVSARVFKKSAIHKVSKNKKANNTKNVEVNLNLKLGKALGCYTTKASWVSTGSEISSKKITLKKGNKSLHKLLGMSKNEELSPKQIPNK